MKRQLIRDVVVIADWDDINRQVTYYYDDGTLRPTAPGGEESNPRPYSPEEVAELEASLVDAAHAENQAVLEDPVSIEQVITELEARIGGGDYVATGIQDPNATLTSLSKMQNAALATDFQNNIGRWMKFLLRTDKRLSNQTIRQLRLTGQLLDSSSLGDEA